MKRLFRIIVLFCGLANAINLTDSYKATLTFNADYLYCPKKANPKQGRVNHF